MQYEKHFAERFNRGDRVKVNIRHENDGDKNLINVEVFVVENVPLDRCLFVLLGDLAHIIPYNEVRAD